VIEKIVRSLEVEAERDERRRLHAARGAIEKIVRRREVYTLQRTLEAERDGTIQLSHYEARVFGADTYIQSRPSAKLYVLDHRPKSTLPMLAASTAQHEVLVQRLTYDGRHVGGSEWVFSGCGMMDAEISFYMTQREIMYQTEVTTEVQYTVDSIVETLTRRRWTPRQVQDERARVKAGRRRQRCKACEANIGPGAGAGVFCGRTCAGAALGAERWHRNKPETLHQLEQGEAVELLWPGGGPAGDNYWPAVRGFTMACPKKDSTIEVWVLPTQPYPGGNPLRYNGWTEHVPVEGTRGLELRRNKRLVRGLKFQWPGTTLEVEAEQEENRRYHATRPSKR
jgi:hypothetical protein